MKKQITPFICSLILLFFVTTVASAITAEEIINKRDNNEYVKTARVESDRLTDLYKFKLIGEEELNGRQCYVLEGIAVEGKKISYYRRKTWVDKEKFIGLKEELYARNGRLLKVITVKEVEQVEDRWYPMESVMENKLRENTRTEFIIKTIEFDPEIPAGTFTLENMR